ncbi:Ino eighty subunit 1 [Leucoagaricus sp. SymC.cos]|nr:Ino eighty subunit 1 [Leucoagaricus sp. SymC.cos]
MASTSATGSGHSNQPAWPPEPIPPVGYLSRKALPIKRNDAEPLTREDVQFDLLNYIFSDTTAAFTSTTPGKTTRISFSELYINALYSSAKCSKVLKDKMIDTPAFAIELAKFSLLTNVGRINTTMAFFPEMKTALRTYHPVPSLQKTDGNAQDAPRIKNCLKAALLPAELKTIPPSTPEEILAKAQAGQKPPTSVVNLIFVLSNHAAPLAVVHFDGSLNFLDLFLPKKGLSSASRARVFLWLIYHYLEDSEGPNPWDDEYSRTNRPKAPKMHYMSEDEQNQENVDMPEEIEWGRKMTAQRNLFLQRLVASVEGEKKSKNTAAPHFIPAAPEAAPPRSRSTRQTHDSPPKDDLGFMYYVPGPSHEREPPPLPVHPPSPVAPVMEQPRRYSYSGPRHHGEERTMLEQAWHIVNTRDPLIDSDDDEIIDDDVRQDYRRRLDIISRVFGGANPAAQQMRLQHSRSQSHPHHHNRHRPLPQSHHIQASHGREPQEQRMRESQLQEEPEREPFDPDFDDLPAWNPGLHPHHSQHRSTPQYHSPRYETANYSHSRSETELQVPSLAVRTSNSNNSSGPVPMSSMSSVSPSTRNVIRLPRTATSRK